MASSQTEALRQRSFEKARQQMQEEISTKRELIAKQNTVSVGKVDDRFQVQQDDVHTALGRATIGLVTLSDFRNKQTQLQEQAAAAAVAAGSTAAARPVTDADKKRAAAAAAKKPVPRPQALSFALDEDDPNSAGGGGSASDSGTEPAVKRPKLLKNPDVDTSFLPDRERERQDQLERARLAAEWREQQERLKKEAIEITYSYWDGTGHRAKLVCKKGDTVSIFLEKARYALPHTHTWGAS
jgi:protein FAM50